MVILFYRMRCIMYTENPLSVFQKINRVNIVGIKKNSTFAEPFE